METFISILRGINVSGHKKILMADLKALYVQLGFKDCTTFIQSGNVIFKAEQGLTNAAIAIKIEAAILAQYKFEVPVLVLNAEEFKKTIQANPFLKQSDIDNEKLHITFLSAIPDVKLKEKIAAINFLPDAFSIVSKAVYLYCPSGYGNTKLNNTFFEKKLEVQATTRNLKTANALLRLACA